MAPSVHCEVIQALESAGTVNVFVICLDKPDSVHNIIDKEFGLALARAVYLAWEKATNGELDVLVVCSAKDRSFLAGADIAHEMKYVGVAGANRAFTELRLLQDVLCVLESLPVPTVALLNGATLGGGLELALACDYRIADKHHCKQIGLPEVKLGYIPGAGGCCRLPRLVGFRPSLDFILTGKSVDAHKALELGMVDHLIVTTQTTVRVDEHGNRSYEYQWFSSILSCIEGGKLGKEAFEVTEREGLSAVDACVNAEERLGSLSEEELMSRLAENWEGCEQKAARKYPRGKGGMRRLIRDYFSNLLFYLLALYQLWRTVGLRMPAPYVALQTTFRCFYTTNWLEAMQLNALGFASVATTAEAKSLSFLFLITRKLKTFALTFGLGSEKSSSSHEDLDKDNTILMVAVSKAGIRFSSAFIQGLLYSGLEVYAVFSGEGNLVNSIKRSVQKHFDYSLKRGHMTPADVEKKMAKLHVFSSSSELSESLVQLEGRQCCIVVNASFSGVREALLDSLEYTCPKVVHLDLLPSSQTSRDDRVVFMNIGDPIRKNTVCIELSPANAKVPAEDVRIAAALVTALGKVPVLTPTSPSLSVSHYLTVHQWSLAASLMVRGGLTTVQIDAGLIGAGFSKGPFTAMKQLDKVYVSQIVEVGSHGGIDCTALKAYLSGTLTVRYRRGKPPPATEIADLFLAGAVNSALLVKKLSPDIPEAAIDILSVSGLTHFPPGEGGPLNYLARIGPSTLDLKLKELAYTPALGTEADAILVSSKLLVETQKESFIDGDKRGWQLRQRRSEFQERSSEFLSLSAEELRKVGPTKGIRNQEVFLYPVPAVAGLTVLLLAVLMITPILLYFILSLF